MPGTAVRRRRSWAREHSLPDAAAPQAIPARPRPPRRRRSTQLVSPGSIQFPSICADRTPRQKRSATGRAHDPFAMRAGQPWSGLLDCGGHQGRIFARILVREWKYGPRENGQVALDRPLGSALMLRCQSLVAASEARAARRSRRKSSKLILLPSNEIPEKRNSEGVLPVTIFVRQSSLRKRYQHLVYVATTEWFS